MLNTILKRKEVNVFSNVFVETVESKTTPILRNEAGEIAMKQSKPIAQLNNSKRVDPFKRITPDDEEKNNA